MRRIVLFLLWSIAPLTAQISPDSGGVNFRTLGWTIAPEDLYYDVNGADVKIAIIDSARSPFIKASKSERIVFYRLVPGPEEELVREEAAVADISAAGAWPLLIFTPDPESPKRYKVLVIADDLKAFPFPSCRFINFTPVDLYAKYGDQQVKVASQKEQLLDPGLKAGGEPETRYTTVSMNTAQGPRVLYSNNWAVRPTQRALVFISAQENKMLVMRVADDIALYTPPVEE